MPAVNRGYATLLLDDPMLMDGVRNAIEHEGVSAERAVASAAGDLTAQFRALTDSYLRERQRRNLLEAEAIDLEVETKTA